MNSTEITKTLMESSFLYQSGMFDGRVSNIETIIGKNLFRYSSEYTNKFTPIESILQEGNYDVWNQRISDTGDVCTHVQWQLKRYDTTAGLLTRLILIEYNFQLQMIPGSKYSRRNDITKDYRAIDRTLNRLAEELPQHTEAINRARIHYQSLVEKAARGEYPLLEKGYTPPIPYKAQKSQPRVPEVQPNLGDWTIIRKRFPVGSEIYKIADMLRRGQEEKTGRDYQPYTLSRAARILGVSQDLLEKTLTALAQEEDQTVAKPQSLKQGISPQQLVKLAVYYSRSSAGKP